MNHFEKSGICLKNYIEVRIVNELVSEQSVKQIALIRYMID